MNHARLMNTPEDYKKLGVNPDKIEVWEDQRRDTNVAGHWEWWYSDFILDDGTKVVIHFDSNVGNVTSGIEQSRVNMQINLPDGTHYEARPSYASEETTYGTGQCDVKYGPHTFKGDLKNYSIYFSKTNGIEVDFKLTNLVQPYRPGSAYFSFDEKDEKYYTWFCAVPRGEVTGTLTINGETKTVHGFGYHDHQWGSINLQLVWNHWLWARQRFDDYTLLVFDMTATAAYGYSRFPIVLIQDKNGNIIFESTNDVSCEILDEYFNEKIGRNFPNKLRYTFKHDGKEVQYNLSVNKIIDDVDLIITLPEKTRVEIEKNGLYHPSYSRYGATGSLTIKSGDETIERSSELIYEFMYLGNKPYREHMEC